MTGPSESPAAPFPRVRRAVFLRAAIEFLVLTAVTLSPWVFAAVHPVSVFALEVVVAAALVLWAAVLLIEGRFSGAVCPVVVCLAGLVALGAWQVVPLPPATLAALSPARAAARAELYPAEPEGVAGEPADPPPATTLSFDPGATRAQVVKLLAVLALFALVRYAVATPASFRRFAVVCAVNGAALSVFALAQRFSSPPNVVYWSFEAQGGVYGPFVCKNHFPYYVNACFGLGLGLLLGSGALRGRHRGAGDLLGELSRYPAVPWLAAGLGLMLAANLYSLSRGGLIAFVGATVACGLLAVATRRRGGAMGGAAVVLIAGLAVGLVGWFGSDAVGKRFGTLSGTDALDGDRRSLWERTLPLALRFPAWGTGYGTFVSVEPQQRQPNAGLSFYWEHAHNDYLEAAVEGGFPHLALVLAATGFVLRAGLRAHRRLRDGPDGALVLGGLFGLTAVALHSLGDFGLHMPAVVVLVAVLSAQLVAAGDPPDRGGAGAGWPVVLPAAVVCLLVAALLPADGWRRERAEHYRLAAIRAEKRLPAGDRDLVVEYLRTAVEFVPDDAALRLRLADVRYEEYLSRRDRQPGLPPDGSDPERTYLRPALRDYLWVRAANPLLARPHARLAGARTHLTNPDAVVRYLDRATRLNPTDAGLWYLAGLGHLDASDPDRAWDCWRRSLVCAPAQLGAILPTALARLGPAGLVDRVLPPDPDLMVAAARLPPLTDRPADRLAVLTRALELLAPGAGRADELYLRAWLLRETGRPAEAIRAYELAVGKAPDRAEWRYELAELYYARGDLPAAAEHLGRVLRDRPDLPGARDLSSTITRVRVGKP